MLVQKLKDLPKLKDINKVISLDTETLTDMSLEGYSFAYYSGKQIKSFYLPIAHEFTDDEKKLYRNVDADKAIAYMNALVKNRQVIFHNAQFDLTVLHQYDIEIPNDNVEDTMLMHFNLDTERKHGLKDIMKLEYDRDVVKYDEAVDSGFAVFSKYAEDDAIFTLELFYDMLKQQKELEEKNPKLVKLRHLYRKVEIPFIRVMQEMNYFTNYIRVDKPLLQKYSDMIFSEVNYIDAALKSKLGNINPGSGKQLGEALLKQGYKVKRNKPTPKMREKAKAKGEEAIGNFSLDAEKLQELYDNQGGIVLGLLLYKRKLDKIENTYVSVILGKLEEVSKGVWILSGYDFFVLGARSGRLNCTNPPMQTQPRDPISLIRTILMNLYDQKIIKKKLSFLLKKDFEDLTDKLLPEDKVKMLNDPKKVNELSIVEQKKLRRNLKIYEDCSVDMRAVYIAMPGKIFVGVDHNQLELRIAGALSKDPEMVKAYNEDRDLHQETANFITRFINWIFSRPDAKETNFFYQYGGWYGTLAKKLGILKEEAKKIDTAYKKLFAVKFAWIAKQIRASRKSHFAQTLLGRRRNMHTLGINEVMRNSSREERSRVFRRRNHAENAVISHIVSGTASDVLKVNQIAIHEKYPPPQARQVLQIHDELLIEIADDKNKYKMLKGIEHEMETSLKLPIKFVVGGKLGYSWRQVHGFILPLVWVFELVEILM